MGFFTDAYDLFSISLLTNILGRIYFQDNPFYLNSTVSPGKLPINYNAAISAVALCGALFGQVLFGFLADCLGRRAVYGLSLAIMIFTGFTQSMTFGTTSHAMVGTLCFWRFLLGVGVGGDYPLSATIMSEYSSTISRGAYIGSVFAMQGIGYLFAAVITAIVTACFATAYPNGEYPLFVGVDDGTNVGKWSQYTSTIPQTLDNQNYYVAQLMDSNPPENDYTWRVVLGFSAIPAALTMYFRLHMAETPRFTLHVLRNATSMTNDMSDMLEGEAEAFDRVQSSKSIQEANPIEDITFCGFLSKYGVHLTGAALSWFFLDVGFYSQSLFQKDVFLQVGFIPPANRMSALKESMVTAKAQALIALGSTIPGYWVTVFTVDILGRKNIQIGGFIAMTSFMAAMAGAYTHLLNPNSPGGVSLSDNQPLMRNGWIAMYAFTFFFANFGPNSTTFIVPAELFPTKFKATGHGICAAIGKAGAIIGSFGFLFAAQPHTLESTWSFPCTFDSDFYFDTSVSPPVRGGCKLKNACPIGHSATGTTVPSLCDICNVKLLSGCAPFGVGVQGALGILAAINFCGLLTTFMIPETMGKSLEELNGELDPSLEKEGKDGQTSDLVGVPAESYA